MVRCFVARDDDLSPRNFGGDLLRYCSRRFSDDFKSSNNRELQFAILQKVVFGHTLSEFEGVLRIFDNVLDI